MLIDYFVPEKEAVANSPDELRHRLETDFKTTYYATTLERIEFTTDGHLQVENQCMPCAPSLLESAAEHIRMPLDYALRVDIDLFLHNFDKRKSLCCTAVTVCCNRGTAINLADTEYRAVHTIDVLEEVIQDETFWKFHEARISDRGVEIDYVEPGREVAPEPDDVIELGIQISNSETGYAGLKASLFSHRRVCTNGAVIMNRLGTARWNYDIRVAYLTSLAKFRKDLFKLKSKQDLQARLYEVVTRRNLLDRQVINLWRRLRSSLPAEAADAVLGIPPDERQTIQTAVRQRGPGKPAEPTPWSVWDIHNRITEHARRFDFRARSRLERLGGSLLAEVGLN